MAAAVVSRFFFQDDHELLDEMLDVEGLPVEVVTDRASAACCCEMLRLTLALLPLCTATVE